MNASPPLLIVGTRDTELEALRQEMTGHELVYVPDGPRAVACLRARRQMIPAVLLDEGGLSDELEELIAYLKRTFPEIVLAVLSPVPPEDQKRLKLLGVSHFLERPITREGLDPLLRRASGLNVRRAPLKDWSVRVNEGHWVEITVPSRENYVSRVRELIDLLERSKLNQDIRDELTMAVDELVRNAMEWGNRYDVDKRVRVSYYCSEDRVVLKVEDEGEGFNVAALRDPTDDPEGHVAARAEVGKRPGGFGVHLIRSLMDEVIYNDRGNIVILTKYLERPSKGLYSRRS